jgi:hypothetical protein
VRKVTSPRSTVAVVAAEPETREVAGYGRFVGAPSRAQLERFFFLDDANSRLAAKRWGDHNRVGFALQLGTVRFLGMIPGDPTDVTGAVCVYVAEQVGAANASWLSGSLDRRTTRFEQVAKITTTYGYREFAVAEAEFVQWLNDRA